MFKRIFLGYLAVILVTFAVLALAFNFTVRRYLIDDTIRSLNRVAETLSVSANINGHGARHMRGAFFNLANRVAYADYLLIAPDRTIIDSSDLETFPPGSLLQDEAFNLLAFSESGNDSLIMQDQVAVFFPIVLTDRLSEAGLILYSRLDVLTQLNRSMLNIFALALVAGTVASLLAGILATRVVVTPLHQLKNRAAELAGRRFQGRLNISTGDELEELAEAFNRMADQLAEYDRSQKEFFQKASHELKTPLMSVQGYAEAIRDGVIPPGEEKESLEIIIRESRRMKALVEEFIFLSKMETIRESYTFEAVNLADAAGEAMHSLRSLALEKEITIETSFGPRETGISGDPEKIHRLLLNIVGNALRHARRSVRVSAAGAEITVEDDGPGFAEGEEEKVFEPFYRGENGGSGLGLAISRAIVEKHGGRITAFNGSGGGAVIRVVFPGPAGGVPGRPEPRLPGRTGKL